MYVCVCVSIYMYIHTISIYIVCVCVYVNVHILFMYLYMHLCNPLCMSVITYVYKPTHAPHPIVGARHTQKRLHRIDVQGSLLKVLCSY